LLRTAAEVGISEDDFWDMLPREFFRRVDAYRRREKAMEEAEWSRALMVFNRIGGVMSALGVKRIKPVTLKDLKKSSAHRAAAMPKTKADYLEMLERIERMRASKGGTNAEA